MPPASYHGRMADVTCVRCGQTREDREKLYEFARQYLNLAPEGQPGLTRPG